MPLTLPIADPMKSTTTTTTKIFNVNFLLISFASFLMFVSFYLVMPIITTYTVDEFGATPTVAGIVVSSYIISALLMRPFSGYLVDRYDHLSFYKVTLALYSLLLVGYLLSASIGAIIVTRILLGASFAMATTSASTLIIDVLPHDRRSEGMGYYGAFIVLSMAIGPMVGLYLLNSFSYTGLFLSAIGTSVLGWAIVFCVKYQHSHQRHQTKLLSLDRFYMKEATPIAIVIALVYFLNGCFMVYVSLYIKKMGLAVSSANFFMLFSAGVLLSRVFSGKALNRRKNIVALQIGLVLIVAGTVIFLYFLNSWTFVILSLLLGAGFGVSAPAVQTYIIDMAPHNRRGTANSTYFIALDVGSGLGMLLGGTIATYFGYRSIFVVGLVFVLIAFVFLRRISKN